MPEVSLASDIIFSIGPVPVTNALLGGLAVSAGIAAFAALLYTRIQLVPGRIQAGFEMILEFFLSQLEAAFGSRERAEKFFPLLMTMLVFIMVANQFSLVPLVSQIVVGEKTLFRLPTSDLSQTILLAIITLTVAHVLAFSASPLGHIGNFIRVKQFIKVRSIGDLANALLEFFLGLLDIIGEIAKVLSLSFRLFGNIFAGEVMVAVIVSLSSFTQFFVPIPFLALSIFSGLIQAFVFALLSAQFIAGTIGVEEKKD